MTFSKRLVLLRKNKGLTQKQIASEFSLSPYGYQRYEYGEREPAISVATKMAEFFGVSLDYLVGRTDNPQVAR